MYPGDQDKQALAADIMQKKSRDNARTPMQWTSSPHAGFTSGSAPWMRVNDDFGTVNAAAQVDDKSSVHAFWKQALQHRKEHADVFVYGDFEMLDMQHKSIVAFKRWSEKEAWVTVCNFSGEKITWDGLKGVKVKEWVVGSYGKSVEGRSIEGPVTLGPWEGILGKVEL
jgi:oligo-1,6-glucosidase